MKGLRALVVALVVWQGVAAAQVRDVDLGISVSDGRLRSFYLAIGEHYGVPPRQVVEVHQRYRYPEDELPVIYFLAARAHVEPSVIIGLRIKRMSWLDIAFHFRLTPDIFFVPVTAARIGPPYGNAYGYYRKHAPGREWGKIVLSDREVVDLVNLRFMTEYYKVPPERVIAIREREHRFVVISDEIRIGKEKARGERPDQGPKGKGNVKKKR
jgi:hypothetical protein